MQRYIPPIVAAILVLGIASVAFAQANLVSATNPMSGVTVEIPENAVEVADNVFYLGEAVDSDSGKTVEGLMFIHNKNNNAKPDNPGNGNGKSNGKGRSSCYAFLANGAKWKSVEDWVVNPSNNQSLSSTFVAGNLADDMAKWENESSANIFGTGSTTTSTLVADTTSTDGLNEVYFGNINSPGAIAVTIVWGIFSGRPSNRELVEWDMIFDEADFDWSDSGAAGKMDFENIATHEIGHAAGMGHPDSSCTEETMYAYAAYGETKKSSLNDGDIAGIQALY